MNTGATGPYLNSQDALQILFDWFFANGGTSRTARSQPTIPGVNTAVDPGIRSASTTESTAGIAREFGSKGSLRVDFIYRQFGDIYGDFIDMSTGLVTDPRTGQQFNLDVVNNTDSVSRNYKGMSTQFSYRPLPPLPLERQLHARLLPRQHRGRELHRHRRPAPAPTSTPNTASRAGTTRSATSTATSATSSASGATTTCPLPRKRADLLGFMQRYDSGRPYDHTMSIDTRPYVTNPGYLVPPSTVTYFHQRARRLPLQRRLAHRPVAVLEPHVSDSQARRAPSSSPASL